MLPVGEEEPRGRPLSFVELRAMALAAEESGLDSIWLPDHLLFRSRKKGTRGIHESWTILSALAALTERVELGPMVMAVPFRNPGLLAKMAATLDEMSGGRLVLGLGCGWHEPEFEAFGYPFDHRVSRFEEALQIIVSLLRTGRADFDGRFYRVEDAELRPRGPRPDGMPILIAATGPRMMRLTARYADAWNGAWYAHPDDAHELDERLAALRAALEEEGRDPATLAITVGLFVAFPHLLDGTEDLPDHVLAGSVDEVSEGLAGYRARGVEHLIVHVWPRLPAAVAELGRAAEHARANLIPA